MGFVLLVWSGFADSEVATRCGVGCWSVSSRVMAMSPVIRPVMVG